MSNTYKGKKTPILQYLDRRWSPSGGYIEEAGYRGFDTAEFQRLSIYMARNGFEYDWRTDHGIHSLMAVDTSGANTIDVWEIALNKLSPSSLKNPLNIRALMAEGSSRADAEAILEDIANIEAGQETSVTINNTPIIIDTYDGLYTLLGDAGHPSGQRLMRRIRTGSDAYYFSGYVLRHTTNVGNRYRRNISDIGVDHIYYTADLLTEARDPNLWVFPLPGRLQYKVQAIEDDWFNRFTLNGAPTIPSNYVLGWLKGGSTETTTANNRVNITTEYEFFAWSSDEYLVF